MVGCERNLLTVHRRSFVRLLGTQKEHQKCENDRKDADEVEVPHRSLVVVIILNATVNENERIIKIIGIIKMSFVCKF